MDIETFNKKIMPMRRQLTNKARAMTGDNSRAEDLVQEVMLKLWSIRSDIERHPNPTALAMTILNNKARDEWRRKREYSTTEKTAEPSTEDHSTETRSDMELIREIVDRLPSLQQKIFRMKEMEGYEAEEIISITGCSPDSLRQNLSRARRTIREEFIRLSNYKRI